MLNRDFKEFIELLNSHNVSYLVIGGYAVAIHGHPRYTKDIDIWVSNDEDNAKRIVAALHEFGFASLGLQPNDFLTSEQVIQLGYPPARIDLLTGIDGMAFDVAFRSHIQVEIDGVPVYVIGLEELKQTKRIAGRPQDIADLSNLE